MNDLFFAFVAACICIFVGIIVHSQTVSSIQTDCRTFGKFRIGEKVFECRENP